jgi:hypothetical protein
MRKAIFGALAAAACLVGGTAQAADSWGLIGEEKARFEAKVVDVLCELTGDCPANCGDGARQLGLLRDDGTLVLAMKNVVPFAGAADELLPFCGERVEADGLFANNRGHRIFALQFVRPVPDGEWRRANRFKEVWAEANDVDPDSETASKWFRHDPRVEKLIERDGKLGLGPAADEAYFADE